MKTRLENARFSRETTKPILNIKVKGVDNLEPKLTTLREELKKNSKAMSAKQYKESKIQNLVESQELLALGQSTIAKQVYNN